MRRSNLTRSILPLVMVGLALPLLMGGTPGQAPNAPTHHNDPRIERSQFPLVENPGLIRSPTPKYPRTAKKLGIEGKVAAELTFDEHGKVIDVRILAGHKSFHHAVRRAAQHWEIAPQTIDGKSTSVRYRTEFEFRMS